MPFNSTSTMLLHRIISQWSRLFLLSHALPLIFFFFFFLHCKMNHGSNHLLHPGESGAPAAWLTNQEPQRQTRGRRQPFVVPSSSTFTTTSPFGPKKLKRRCVCVREQRSAAVFSSPVIKSWLICLQRSRSSHDVKWDHDVSAIPSRAGPPSALLTVPG